LPAYSAERKGAVSMATDFSGLLGTI